MELVNGYREGGTGKGEADPAVGSRQWAEDFLWRVVSSIRAVEIDVRIDGAVTSPSIRVSSNVGDVVAENLRRELGQEVQRAERQVRREVDRLVRQQIVAARAKVATLETGIEAEIALRISEVTRLEADLQAELQKFARGRIRIP